MLLDLTTVVKKEFKFGGVDLSIHVNKGLPIEQVHAIAHKVEDQFKSNFEGIEDVVVHLEPDDDHSSNTQDKEPV